VTLDSATVRTSGAAVGPGPARGFSGAALQRIVAASGDTSCLDTTDFVCLAHSTHGWVVIADPVNPKFVKRCGGDRIMRGHAFYNVPSADEDAVRRAWDDPKWCFDSHGFRLSCTLPCNVSRGVV